MSFTTNSTNSYNWLTKQFGEKLHNQTINLVHSTNNSGTGSFIGSCIQSIRQNLLLYNLAFSFLFLISSSCSCSSEMFRTRTEKLKPLKEKEEIQENFSTFSISLSGGTLLSTIWFCLSVFITGYTYMYGYSNKISNINYF